MFKQLKTKKFNEQIIDQIKGLIEDGTLKKGDKLPPERLLAEQFGSSRASIREAMSAMDMMGIIESRSGSGNYIKIDIKESSIDEAMIGELLTHHNLFDVYEARQEIEPSLVSLATIRRTDKEISDLQKIQTKLLDISSKLITNPKYADNYMEEDIKFHLKIAEMAHNPILFKLYASICLLLREETWQESKRADILKNGTQQTEMEHIAISEAIIKGDPQLARKKLQVHLERIRIGLLVKLGEKSKIAK